MDSLVETILTNTYTTDELNERLALLRDFFEEQFFAEGANQLQEFFAKRRVAPHRQKAMLLWNKEFYRAFNQENLYKLMERLSEGIGRVPKVTLETALDLSADRRQTARLARWFRQNLDPQTLISLKVNPQIVGGVKIAYGATYGDYSLRAKLEKSREARRKLFLRGLG